MNAKKYIIAPKAMERATNGIAQKHANIINAGICVAGRYTSIHKIGTYIKNDIIVAESEWNTYLLPVASAHRKLMIMISQSSIV